MGCDIHFFVEKKINDKWEMVVKKDDFYDSRNYQLFSILADVRNGIGCAGCDTGDRLNPIADRRGLPEDLSDGVKSEAQDWRQSDGHSFSWFILRELLDYDWTQTATLRGMVNGPQLYDWSDWRREKGLSPKEYCGGIGGPNLKHVPEQELLKLIEGVIAPIQGRSFEMHREREAAVKRQLGNYYCTVEWKEPYHRCCSEFWSETMPRLLRVGKPDEVRIVFWFDN